MTATIPRLLIVDDQPASIELLLDYLSHHELDISVALEGADALKRAVSFKPDLILLDIVMPGMNGFEVCAALKQDVACQAIPVIFLSGSTDVAEKLHGFSLGAVDYITKPFSSEEVLARISVHLNSMKRIARLESLMASQVMDHFGEEANRDHQIFANALSVLEADIADPPTLLDLSHRVGTNERKITEIFREHVGMTVFEYLTELRMEISRSLLEKGDMQVQLIAEKVGYRNAGDFSRAFRHRFNVTPREYRQARRPSSPSRHG